MLGLQRSPSVRPSRQKRGQQYNLRDGILLEPIYGNAAGITGNVTFDPKAPEKTTGKVILNTSSLHVANKLMKEHMHGDGWMNVNLFPAITFTLEKLTDVKKQGDNYIGNAVGKMSILKASKEISVPVTLTFLKGRLAERNRVEGDLLVVRSKFVVKRDDYGINPGQKLLKVANDIEIRVGIAGGRSVLKNQSAYYALRVSRQRLICCSIWIGPGIPRLFFTRLKCSF